MSNIGKYIADPAVTRSSSWPDTGDFMSPPSSIYSTYWGSCRDVFHGDFNIKLHDHFYWASSTYKKQARFIEVLEDLLNIKSQHRTVFNPIKGSSYPTMVKITPSPFWLAENIRICFFTIVLKATLDHKGRVSRNALISCLKDCDYSEQTERAIALFLSGRTVLKKDKEENWVNRFRYKDSDDMTTTLSFPKAYRLHRRKMVKSNLTAKEKLKLSRWVNDSEDGYEYKYSFTFNKSC